METIYQNGVVIQASPVKQAPLYEKKTHGESSCPSFWRPKTQANIEQSFVDFDTTLLRPLPASIIKHWDEFMNPLLGMCILGYDQHRPIVLTPDLLWHQIVKGVSKHVETHSEHFRHTLVYHEGKKTLSVRRDEFVRGGTNDWPGVFREFRAEIEKNIRPEAKCLIGQTFTSTTPTIADTSCIALMETFKSYFDYKMYTLCGIPCVTLIGKLEDWETLAICSRQVLHLFDCDDDNLSLKWWSKGLLPVLDKLVKCYISADDKDNKDWMARIFKYNREFESGGVDHVTGWINVFFPYMASGEINPLAMSEKISKKSYCKWQLNEYPRSVSEAPFTWHYLTEVFTNMTFAGGPCCVMEQQEHTDCVSPVGSIHVIFGWAIIYPQFQSNHESAQSESVLEMPYDYAGGPDSESPHETNMRDRPASATTSKKQTFRKCTLL